MDLKTLLFGPEKKLTPIDVLKDKAETPEYFLSMNQHDRKQAINWSIEVLNSFIDYNNLHDEAFKNINELEFSMRDICLALAVYFMGQIVESVNKNVDYALHLADLLSAYLDLSNTELEIINRCNGLSNISESDVMNLDLGSIEDYSNKLLAFALQQKLKNEKKISLYVYRCASPSFKAFLKKMEKEAREIHADYYDD